MYGVVYSASDVNETKGILAFQQPQDDFEAMMERQPVSGKSFAACVKLSGKQPVGFKKRGDPPKLCTAGTAGQSGTLTLREVAHVDTKDQEPTPERTRTQQPTTTSTGAPRHNVPATLVQGNRRNSAEWQSADGPNSKLQRMFTS